MHNYYYYPEDPSDFRWSDVYPSPFCNYVEDRPFYPCYRTTCPERSKVCDSPSHTHYQLIELHDVCCAPSQSQFANDIKVEEEPAKVYHCNEFCGHKSDTDDKSSNTLYITTNDAKLSVDLRSDCSNHLKNCVPAEKIIKKKPCLKCDSKIEYHEVTNNPEKTTSRVVNKDCLYFDPKSSKCSCLKELIRQKKLNKNTRLSISQPIVIFDKVPCKCKHVIDNVIKKDDLNKKVICCKCNKVKAAKKAASQK